MVSDLERRNHRVTTCQPDVPVCVVITGNVGGGGGPIGGGGGPLGGGGGGTGGPPC
jgi:hypothetical protein